MERTPTKTLRIPVKDLSIYLITLGTGEGARQFILHDEAWEVDTETPFRGRTIWWDDPMERDGGRYVEVADMEVFERPLNTTHKQALVTLLESAYYGMPQGSAMPPAEDDEDDRL